MDNLWAWIALGVLLLFIIMLNLSLVAALRRKPGKPEGAFVRGLKLFARSSTADSEARQKQSADLDELHRRVAGLRQRDE